MVTAIKDAIEAEANPDLHAIMNDIASLKHDLAMLAGHWKDSAVDTTSDAAGQIGKEASRLYDNLASQGGRSADAIGRQIEKQPVMSLLLAFALGFLGSRLLPR
ncbi:hypothetical protein [Telmatospirillum sp.]|uniref:hypothetical protein n=1 Tax=Telmatospirillum sp. TaxID=2079197 RepID=UPI00283C3B8F|nr:hypothetical protein [Telmatospirillum sp.]MDR3440537.1 hypothetical protein [Telmatospirillum sp.]